MTRTLASVLALLAAAACTDLDDGQPTGAALGQARQPLAAEVELARLTAIRDTAASLGLTNGVLLAGIAQSETNLSHCWSEATYACKGPNSPSCGGGPVIAGSADGPCSAQQGGLGMFQFDAGTYAQTLARDGDDILLVEGNIAKAVEFVTDRVIEEIPGVISSELALEWLNAIPMAAADPLMDAWADFIVCRYNGCCSGAAVCQQRRADYRDNALDFYAEYGAEFWGATSTATDCAEVPAAGRVIDETDACYLAAGPAASWRQVDGGYDGSRSWTKATDDAASVNIGTWRLALAAAGRYQVEVHLDGGEHGQSRQASYEIVHGGETTEVVIDQSTGTGFVSLGAFDFAAGGDQHVRLGDATGEPLASDVHLVFDAIRLVPATGGDLGGDDQDGDGEPDTQRDETGGLAGGCAAGGGGGAGGLALVLLLGLSLVRPARRR